MLSFSHKCSSLLGHPSSPTPFTDFLRFILFAGVVAHAFGSNTQEAEAGKSL